MGDIKSRVSIRTHASWLLNAWPEYEYIVQLLNSLTTHMEKK